MTLEQAEKNLIEELSFFESWEQKYQYLIDLAKELPQMKEKSDKFLIKGCQSQVWLLASLEKQKIILKADSDALLPKGIASLMVKIYSEKSPFEILKSKGDFISKIGFKEFLSPIRASGMLAMLAQIRVYAEVFARKLLLENPLSQEKIN